jgi:phage terminase large subunit GpA-like protein
LRIEAMAVDSGYRSHTVYKFVARWTARHVFAVKGQSQGGKSILGRPTLVDVNHDGQVIKAGAKLWAYGADTAKSTIYDRLLLAAPGPGFLHFPVGLPDEYYQQLTAESLVPVYDKRGYYKMQWRKDETARNEALDLEGMCLAAAIYAGVARMEWDKLEAAIDPAQRDLFVTARKNSAPAASDGGDKETRVGTPAPSTKPRPRGDDHDDLMSRLDELV